ncbi:sushi domain-containing protein 2 isoform X3 [Archocentrus centrarchus]|nr:sushi domain-containing protein 2-like isoform X3 [Archocentrus centrarchus]
MTLMSCCADYNQSCFQVMPHSSSMLGGEALRCLSLDLPPGGKLLCRFKGEILRDGFIDAEGHAYCISPLLYETGWIPFDVSTDGINFDRSAQYFSVHPSKADPTSKVILVNATQWQNYGTPNVGGRLKMTWNNSLIRAERINVELWAYRESQTGGGTNASPPPQAQLHYLYSLGRNLTNSGAFSFSPKPRREYSDWELGNIRITAGSTAEGERDVRGLWSGAHLLAWHLEEAFRENSAAWARSRCLQWDDLETNLPDFLSELIDCPCTLAQARADTGRFHTDSSCDIERGSVCTYHPGCVHCVRAIQASPEHGAGQQCCYDHSGDLVFTGDSVGGSTPDRAHDWGSPPYVQPPRVPGYSHWLHDVLSFYHCCLWSDRCHVYLKHRPSSGCQNYQPPRAGVVLGHSHYVTFDGLRYTFSGKGEYHLVSSPETELSVQVRTAQVKLKNGTLARATRLSSVAMKQNGSDVIEVRLAAGARLQVLKNQSVLPFTEQSWMELHGVFVFSSCPESVTVTFSSGAAVEARMFGGNMAVTVLLPAEFNRHARGLLGSMNSDPSDDLTTQLGEVIPSANATSEEVFTFGAGWNISKNSSLFTYDSEHLLHLYSVPSSHDAAFVPAFSPPQSLDDPLVADVLVMCYGEGAQFCKHDALMTQNLTVGNATLRAYEEHRALMEALKPVVSCGWLPTPRNGRKNGTRYLEASTLSFTCSQGYIMYESAERTCLGDGTWTGEQPYCITDDQVGFVLGAVGSLSALVAVAVMIKLHNRKQKRERKDEPIQMVNQEQTC